MKPQPAAMVSPTGEDWSSGKYEVVTLPAACGWTVCAIEGKCRGHENHNQDARPQPVAYALPPSPTDYLDIIAMLRDALLRCLREIPPQHIPGDVYTQARAAITNTDQL